VTFTATSGNIATMTVKQKGIKRTVDFSWTVPPSDADIGECNTWYLDNYGHDIAAVACVVTDGPETAAKVAREFMRSPEDN